MTAKELKKLSRRDLLEILLEQSKQMQRLQEELDEAKEKLASRKLEIDKAGSIAEASLKLSGVFDAAQAACQQYMENIENMSRRQEDICREMELKCQQEIQKRLEETEHTRKEMIETTKRQCVEILTKAKLAAEAYKHPRGGNQ